MNGQDILAMEVALAIGAWSILTVTQGRRAFRDGPVSTLLIYVLIWSTLVTQAVRSLWDFGVVGLDATVWASGTSRALFVLIGIIALIASWSSARARPK